MDICLAKAGLGQLVIIGSGGTFITEFVKGEGVNTLIYFGSMAFFLAAAIGTYGQYKKASRLSKKSKTKRL